MEVNRYCVPAAEKLTDNTESERRTNLSEQSSSYIQNNFHKTNNGGEKKVNYAKLIQEHNRISQPGRLWDRFACSEYPILPTALLGPLPRYSAPHYKNSHRKRENERESLRSLKGPEYYFFSISLIVQIQSAGQFLSLSAMLES